jgi:hypothetical protein
VKVDAVKVESHGDSSHHVSSYSSSSSSWQCDGAAGSVDSFAELNARYLALLQDKKDLVVALAAADETLAAAADGDVIVEMLESAKHLGPAPENWWTEPLMTRVKRELARQFQDSGIVDDHCALSK